MEIHVSRNDDKNRFETTVHDELCVLDYQVDGSTVRMTRVLVPDAAGGQGVAGELTRSALDWARAQAFEVVPACPYIAAWIRKHPDYADLVAE